MSGPGRRAWSVLLAIALPACASGGRAVPPLAPPPAAAGSLAIRIVYPKLLDTGLVRRAETRIASTDSAFVLGSVGRGDATLYVNGRQVDVYPTGGWIAWLPLPDDTVAAFDLVAAAGGDTARLRFEAALPVRYRTPAAGPWIDTTTFHPVGDRWVLPGEEVRLGVRASPGAAVTIVTGDSLRIPLIRLFPHATDQHATAGAPDRYAGRWTGPLGPDPGAVLAPQPAPPADTTAWLVVEAVLHGDTARARWPLRLALVDRAALPVVVVNDDTAGTGSTDRQLAGRPTAWGTYHWFFPNGTRAAVSGRWNDQVRLQLSSRSVAWVDAADVQPLPAGIPRPGLDRVAGSPRLSPSASGVTLRIPLAERIPFRVDEGARDVRLTLYGVVADMDWIHYGGADPLVELIGFGQPVHDEVEITVTLSNTVWGYRTRWGEGGLLLEIRRPPRIDPKRPLRDRVIALDAGHPPGGATGPTGVSEAAVALAVVRATAALLAERGARPVLVRTDTLPLDLAARVRRAEAADADVLVSVHANALPDGVNPFTTTGTSVYYFHPRSAPLARAMNRALVGQFGFPDLGFGRGDLALTRSTWMPAVLAEGLFLILPDQEAVLASEEGQVRYARGIVEGIERFLRERAGR